MNCLCDQLLLACGITWQSWYDAQDFFLTWMGLESSTWKVVWEVLSILRMVQLLLFDSQQEQQWHGCARSYQHGRPCKRCCLLWLRHDLHDLILESALCNGEECTWILWRVQGSIPLQHGSYNNVHQF